MVEVAQTPCNDLTRMQGIMVTQRQSEKEGNLKELFVKTPAKRQEHTLGMTSGDNRPTADEQVEEDTTPITKSYLEHLFGGLRGDIAILKQEIATTSKDLKREVAELEQRMDTVNAPMTHRQKNWTTTDRIPLTSREQP
ncbi:hypothetical protein NDU88_000951 [Pleurodeles waltl]|uniref:Uncharacterized protein n=1 Tax=Pleurodeles waltl TaxID=8319 RepID=A0AAV7VZ08_PLEWA|nr:hypothetical protein NDU88_000951 [Pleurodeles waltl]